MRRTSKVYLSDILEAIQNIEVYTKNMGFEDFRKSKMARDAVIRNLEIIGEAVKNIPDDIKSKHPEIAWGKVAGLRDRLIHRYFEVDLEILWDILKNELPDLKTKISSMLQEEET